jgi:hypothetical protein
MAPIGTPPHSDDAQADRSSQYPSHPPHSHLRANDHRAIISLVLGLASLVTCGITGVPAIGLGLTARSRIARSRGALGGGAFAIAGIATGFAGTVLALVGVAAFVAGLTYSAGGTTARRPLFTPSPESTTAWAPTAPSMAVEPLTIGAIHVVDLDPEAKRTFRQQLADEVRRAATAHQTVVVMTSARWCGVCKEIQAALPDPRMQAALMNVDLVRVDVDDFDDELRAAGMLEDTLPWFYKVDATLHPADAISAGEWDENIPLNMAPVLKSFLAGTLRARRDPTGVGTVL